MNIKNVAVIPIGRMSEFVTETRPDNAAMKALAQGEYRTGSVSDEAINSLIAGDRIAHVSLAHDTCAFVCNGEFRITDFVVGDTKGEVTYYRCRIESIGELEFNN